MKRFSAGLLCFGVLISIISMISAPCYANVGTSAKAAILIEAKSGDVLYEKNAEQVVQMASTTKIMTTLLCIESGNIDEYFEVDSDAIKVEGSSMGLVEGDKVTKRILCYGMMLPSGNDAANATAVKLAGSISEFAKMMNERAVQIGMNNTNFVTPSGLDDYTDYHYSTAYDMALLAREALKNPVFCEICSTKNAKLEYGNPPYQRWLSNSNKLLTSCDGCIGIKTGFTDKARRCLVSACERDGTTLICVTLNDSDDWNDHRNLYDYGFAQIEKISMPFDNEDMLVSVVGGKRELAYLKLAEKPEISVARGRSSEVIKTVIIPKFCYAPLEKGQQVGEVRYYKDGELLKTIPVIVDEDVEQEDSVSHKENIFKKIIRKIRD